MNNVLYRCLRKMKILAWRFYVCHFCKNISIGNNLNFRKGFEINCSKSGRVVIGDRVFFNNYCSINAHEYVEIGNDCILGEGVKIYDHNHIFNLKNKSIQSQGFSTSRVVIGDNCWIGSNVVILPGTNIGSGTVVGAGCVVKGSIPEKVILKYNIDSAVVMENIKYNE